MLYNTKLGMRLRKTFSAVALGTLAMASIFTFQAPSFAHAATLPITDVYASPSSGTLNVGQNLEVYFVQPDQNGDVQIDGTCTVNGSNISTLEYLTDGLYRMNYTVAQGDTDREPGAIPLSCNIKNGAGDTTTISAFTDGNTLAINAQGDDNGGGGGGGGGSATSTTQSETVSTVPSSGTIGVGQTLEVHFQQPNNANDIAIGGICAVNGVQVAPLVNLTDGQYVVNYTVSQGDPNVTTGQVPLYCDLTNTAGEHSIITAFTDGNTVMIDGGTTGTTTPPTSTTTQITVSASPSTGTVNVGQSLHVLIDHTGGENNIVLNGACTVNGVNVSPLENLGNGHYRLTYNVAQGDASRAPGTVPLSCNLANNQTWQTALITAFTDGNTVAINGTGTTTTPGGTASSTTDGVLDGNVQGGTSTSTAPLAVTGINLVQGTATADGTYEHGLKWIFNITVPTDETSLSMKFDDWVRTPGGDVMPVANNMRITSTQASSPDTATVTAANTYTVPLNLVSDLNSITPGRQIQVTVEMKVPAGSVNGQYGTTYHIQSL